MKAGSNATSPPPDRRGVPVRLARWEEDIQWFGARLATHHYLGAGRSVGDSLRQIVQAQGRPVALLVWGTACYALKARDR